MAEDERLQEALMEVAGRLSWEHTRVEIEGTGGLTLRMMVERGVVVWREVGEKAPERLHLKVEDSQGEALAVVVSQAKQAGAFKDEEILREQLEWAVARLVSGGGVRLPLSEIIEQRTGAAEKRLAGLLDAAVRVQEAQGALGRAQEAERWLGAVREGVGLEATGAGLLGA